MRLTRAMLLEVLRQDYVRTAWAKGLEEGMVVLKHSLKNALIPVITILGIQFAQVFSQTVNMLGDALRDVLDPRLRGTGGAQPH